MAHEKQREFFRKVKSMNPQFFTDVKVLDIGSLDINGSNRHAFEHPYSYIGVDLSEGKNVDVICPGHLYESGYQFDTVISSATRVPLRVTFLNVAISLFASTTTAFEAATVPAVTPSIVSSSASLIAALPIVNPVPVTTPVEVIAPEPIVPTYGLPKLGPNSSIISAICRKLASIPDGKLNV